MRRSVDLAYVLRGFGVRFCYMTTTLGVDPTYQDQAFYKPTLDADALRVNKLFAKAKAADVCIERGSLSQAELASLVSGQQHLVMALVDRRLLHRPAASVSGLVESWLQGYLGQGYSGYVGHYVLLHEYDAARDGFLYNDPARREAGPVFIGASELDAARKAHGTDEDVLIIPWDVKLHDPLLRRQGQSAPVAAVTRAAAATATRVSRAAGAVPGTGGTDRGTGTGDSGGSAEPRARVLERIKYR